MKTKQEPVSASHNKSVLRQDDMAPYNAIGLVKENFKVRDLSIFLIWRFHACCRLLETKINQEPLHASQNEIFPL